MSCPVGRALLLRLNPSRLPWSRWWSRPWHKDPPHFLACFDFKILLNFFNIYIKYCYSSNQKTNPRQHFNCKSFWNIKKLSDLLVVITQLSPGRMWMVNLPKCLQVENNAYWNLANHARGQTFSRCFPQTGHNFFINTDVFSTSIFYDLFI